MKKSIVVLLLIGILILPMCLQEEAIPPKTAEAIKEEVKKEIEKPPLIEEKPPLVPEKPKEPTIEIPIVTLKATKEELPWAILVGTRKDATIDYLKSEGFRVYLYEEWVSLTVFPRYDEVLILRTEDPILLMYGARYAKLTNKLLVVGPCGCEITKLEYITKRHAASGVILLGEEKCLLPGEVSKLKAILERFVTVVTMETTAEVAKKVYEETGRRGVYGGGGVKRKVPPANIG